MWYDGFDRKVVMKDPDGIPILDVAGEMIPLIDVPAFFDSLYTYAWFVSFILSFVIHIALTRLFPPPTPQSDT